MTNLQRKLEQIKSLVADCLAELPQHISHSSQKKNNYKKDKITGEATASVDLDFSMPIRPFIKKNSIKLSGPKKFILLLAYLTKGQLGKEVELVQIEKNWKKMTAKALLGMKFNRFYPGEAKLQDWVESKKAGFYNLRPSWKNIFSK